MIQNIPSQIPQKQYYQAAPWKLLGNSVRWIHTSQRTFSESFFPVFIWEYFLVTIGFNVIQSIPSQIPQKRYYQSDKWKESCNSMRWIHTSKGVTQKISFRYLSEDISFVTIGFIGIQSIPSQIPQKQCYQSAPWKEWCNSVGWIQSSQSCFSDSFFPVFIWRYYLFHRIPQCTPEYPIADSTKKVLADVSMKSMV